MRSWSARPLPECADMARRRILFALALLGCVIFYLAYQKWFSWVLLLVMLTYPWLSLLLSLGDMLQLKLEPVGANRIPMGAEEKIQTTAVCPGIQPPLRNKFRVIKPNTGESWILKPGEPLPTAHCGGLIAEPYRAKVYDYLGLFSLKIRRTQARTFLVMPGPANMDVPPDLTRYLARSWKPKFGGGYAENHEIRLYRPGDNLNQVHWKLSAKVGDLMLREPMEPDQGLMLLTMDLKGAPSELDSKFGRLLWLGNWFLEQRISFEIRVLTGSGIKAWVIREEWDLQKCVDELLCAESASEGSILERDYSAAWQHHIGGEPDET